MNERYEMLENKKNVITAKQDLVNHWYECVDTLVSEDIIDQRVNKTCGNNFYWKLIKDINKIFPGQEIIISQKIKSSLPKVF